MIPRSRCTSACKSRMLQTVTGSPYGCGPCSSACRRKARCCSPSFGGRPRRDVQLSQTAALPPPSVHLLRAEAHLPETHAWIRIGAHQMAQRLPLLCQLGRHAAPLPAASVPLYRFLGPQYVPFSLSSLRCFVLSRRGLSHRMSLLLSPPPHTAQPGLFLHGWAIHAAAFPPVARQR